MVREAKNTVLLSIYIFIASRLSHAAVIASVLIFNLRQIYSTMNTLWCITDRLFLQAS